MHNYTGETKQRSGLGENATQTNFQRGLLFNYLILVEEHAKLLDTDPQIRFIKLVRNIPSEGSKLSSLLDRGVEETKTKEKFLECPGLFAGVEELRITDWICKVGSTQVSLQTLRGLVSHFNTVLQDGDGERRRGVRCQPQSKKRTILENELH